MIALLIIMVLSNFIGTIPVYAATDPENALDGFFNFRLKRVKERWGEIINLANENSIVLSDENVCGEFLSFLIDALPKTDSCLKLKNDGENTLLFLDGQKIQPLLPFGKKFVDEEVVLFNLLQILPKRVVVDERGFSNEFLNILNRYF